MNTQDTNLMQKTALIRLSTVMRMTGYSKSWIYQAIKAGNFPKPIKLGPSVSIPALVPQPFTISGFLAVSRYSCSIRLVRYSSRQISIIYRASFSVLGR